MIKVTKCSGFPCLVRLQAKKFSGTIHAPSVLCMSTDEIIVTGCIQDRLRMIKEGS